MAKVLVLYYSMYGHIETMAEAVAEGAAVEDGVHVLLGHFAELVVFRRL